MEAKKLKRIKAAQERRICREYAKQAKHDLEPIDVSWFLNKVRRKKLQDKQIIRIYANERQQFMLDVETTGPRKADWHVPNTLPIYVSPLPLFVYKHLIRKHGHHSHPDFEEDFWNAVNQWLADRTSADAIIGVLELEAEGFNQKLYWDRGRPIFDRKASPYSQPMSPRAVREEATRRLEAERLAAIPGTRRKPCGGVLRAEKAKANAVLIKGITYVPLNLKGGALFLATGLSYERPDYFVFGKNIWCLDWLGELIPTLISRNHRLDTILKTIDEVAKLPDSGKKSRILSECMQTEFAGRDVHWTVPINPPYPHTHWFK